MRKNQQELEALSLTTLEELSPANSHVHGFGSGLTPHWALRRRQSHPHLKRSLWKSQKVQHG